ncbi:MAG: radical SAM protein [Dehalococcoidales bacterium]
MDLLLIDPPYMSLKSVSTDCGYNVGLTSLAAYVRKQGIDTAVLTGDLLMDVPSNKLWTHLSYKDYALAQQNYAMIVDDKDHFIWERIADIVKQTSPMAVGIPYMTPLKHVVERVARLVKEINGDIKVIAGHAHPTFNPEEVLQNPDIDFVIRGEGEITLLHLMNELKNDNPKLETVPGIYYRDRDDQVRSNAGVDLIRNLDELPFLARDLVLNCDYNSYREHELITTRGCPYTCSFCADRQLWGGVVRRRSVDNVIEEMKLLEDTYKVNLVAIVDGTFTFDRNYLQTFCNTLINLQLNIKWGCTARYDNLDEDLLRLMKRANCSGMYFGLESGSDRVLNAMDKKITVEKIIEVSNMVHDSGIPSFSSVLLGLPYETKEDAEATLKLMRTIKTDFYDVNSFIPLPGTPLYDSMSEEVKGNIDWRKVAMKSFDNYFLTSMSHEEFNEYVSEAYKIADSTRRKSLIRLGAKMLPRFVASTFKRLWQ